MKKPEIKFYISSKENSLVKNEGVWSDFIPSNRHNSETGEENQVTYGDYFSGIESFLSENNFINIVETLSSHLNKKVSPDDISSIDLILIKHGEFYHPVNLQVDIFNEICEFVINGAVSGSGISVCEKEYGVLKELEEKYSSDFIPKVWNFFEKTVSENKKISLFMAEWFENFHEFHISFEGENKKGIIVWDSNKNFFLSDNDKYELYKQCTFIMTGFYDLFSFEQIQPWHHAAGDFIIRKKEDQIDIKLITVRNYLPLFESEESEEDEDEKKDLSATIESLLIFFINLSLRMRLDRIDGIKETVWSDDVAVKGFVDGFIKGLMEKNQELLKGEKASETFLYFIKAFDESYFHELSNDIINSYNQNSPDIPVIKNNISQHVSLLFKTILSY